MYKLIDEAKIATYYFNDLASGEIDGSYMVILHNVKYVLDNKLKVDYVKKIYAETPSKILTTEGFVKWEPIYIVSKDEKTALPFFKESPNFKKHVKTNSKPQDKADALVRGMLLLKEMYMANYAHYAVIDAEIECVNYVCFNQVKNPKQITKDDFNAIAPYNTTIYEEDDNLIAEVEKGPVEIVLQIKGYDTLVTFANKLIISKGTCFSIKNDIYCY